jgi:hypothetical protein
MAEEYFFKVANEIVGGEGEVEFRATFYFLPNNFAQSVVL